ncbi:hypothetical protein [Kribbella deserti]|uniref:DUF4760 domain-containing protein n=1 Tax=Kribbella deserti TaxID=1926257 RepID=A0ABV6QE56_9ACTN
MPLILSEGVFIALVALGGTLAGGLVTALTQLLVSHAGAKAQAQSQLMQAKRDNAARWRDERYLVYTEFARKERATQLVVENYSDAYIEDESEPSEISRREAQALAALEDIDATLAKLTILAGPELSHIAALAVHHLWNGYDQPDTDVIYNRESKIEYQALVRAMQSELGIDIAWPKDVLKI